MLNPRESSQISGVLVFHWVSGLSHALHCIVLYDSFESDLHDYPFIDISTIQEFDNK